MKRKFTQIVAAVALTVGLVAPLTLAPSAGAINVFEKACPSNGGTAVCGAESKDDAPSQIKNIVNILLYLLGIIAVIMIVIGGIRYTTSNGDSGNIKSAKDTILYAVVGLIVAIMAYAIVNFVVTAFK